MIRYSMAFKQKVVSEIECGRVTVGDAERIYGINGHGTIDKWLRKFGKNDLLAKVVRIEMKGEKDKVRELEKEKRVLESALAQSQLKIMMLERYVEIAKDKYGIDLKKKNGTDVLDGVSPRSKKLA
jgi:transposase-like protein